MIIYHMIQNYTTYRVLRLFFDSPTKRFQLRSICRMTKLGMPSVAMHVKRLQKEGLIEKKKDGIYPNYTAAKNDKFRLYKRNDVVLRIHESGLLDFLSNEFVPDAIVLFGSSSRGEDVESSDIDLLVIAKEKRIDIGSYEKALKRKINIMFIRFYGKYKFSFILSENMCW